MRHLTGWLLFGACAALCSCTSHLSGTAQTQDVVVGTGKTAAIGDSVMLAYTGKLKDGTTFDTNVPSVGQVAAKPPFTFTLTSEANSETVAGMNQGVLGMRVGGERKITIPPDLGYGDKAYGPIPANSELVFDVKLLGLIKKGVQSESEKEDEKVGDGPAAQKGDWVTITYTLDLLNGYPLGSSKEYGDELQFQAGTGEIGDAKIVKSDGVTDGVVGMKAGGVRVVKMTTDLAYSIQGGYPAEANDQLVQCTIKMLRISKTRIASKK